MVISYGECVKQKIKLILELVSICCFILQISNLTKKCFVGFLSGDSVFWLAACKISIQIIKSSKAHGIPSFHVSAADMGQQERIG